MAQLTFYVSSWTDQDAFLCFVALREKTLDFEVKQPSAEERAHAFAGRVPAVAHDGHFVSEGIAVAEYLAETFPFPGFPRLFPADLKQRSWCRQVMLWPRVALSSLFAERTASAALHPRPWAPLSPAAQTDAERLVQAVEHALPAGRATLFDAWCIADADLSFTLGRLIQGGHPVPARLRAYAGTHWARPSTQEFLARVQVAPQP